MKKYIYTAIILFVFILGFFYLSYSKSDTVPQNLADIEPDEYARSWSYTPTPYPKENNPLNVVSVLPMDNSVSVSTDDNITVTFNRELKEEDIIFSIEPKFEYRMEIDGYNLKIIPSKPLSSGTKYFYVIKYRLPGKIPQGYSFTTLGPTPQITQNTQPEGGVEETEKFYLENHPDIFLSNKTPYSTADFSVEWEFVKEPYEHFEFNVELFGNNDDRSYDKFILWLQSLGLTNKQINALDIYILED
jgi:hypothetical protein